MNEAWALPEDEALAYFVVLHEQDGQKFDWKTMSWEKPAS